MLSAQVGRCFLFLPPVRHKAHIYPQYRGQMWEHSLHKKEVIHMAIHLYLNPSSYASITGFYLYQKRVNWFKLYIYLQRWWFFHLYNKAQSCTKETSTWLHTRSSWDVSKHCLHLRVSYSYWSSQPHTHLHLDNRNGISVRPCAQTEVLTRSDVTSDASSWEAQAVSVPLWW